MNKDLTAVQVRDDFLNFFKKEEHTYVHSSSTIPLDDPTLLFVNAGTYHHTFLEMLGSWSFGDYFKKEAIEWSWKLLHEVWGIQRDRLYATYFEGAPEQGVPADEEAKSEWLKYLPADQILPGNMKETEL